MRLVQRRENIILSMCPLEMALTIRVSGYKSITGSIATCFLSLMMRMSLLFNFSIFLLYL